MKSADHIYVNGRILTLDENAPRAEALAVSKGRIHAVGSNDDINRLRGPQTRIVDLRGSYVLPGLIDGHAHMAGLGSMGLGVIDLVGTESFQAVIDRVRDRVASAKPGEWILGRGWDHEDWADKNLPSHEALSAVSPANPVWLQRVDGHIGLANAAAMAAAAIDKTTPTPAGGEILKNSRGEPNGLLVDRAMELVDKAVPGLDSDTEAEILKAQELCLAAGLTGVHDAGLTQDQIAVYRKLDADGRLKIRVYGMVAYEQALDHVAREKPHVGDRFTLRAVKIYADGALGSRGAWLLSPYADRSTDGQGQPYMGLPVTPPEDIRRVVQASVAAGYQVCTHAIGDRANREMLDIYESVQKAGRADGGANQDLRLRIEHAQIVAPADVPRFAKLGVIASMQPTHATSDMSWVADRLGNDRLIGAYAWASLMKNGAHVSFGSDFPVESHNPFLGVYAAVTRQDLNGAPTGGWRAQECVSREQALRGFTVEAAYSAFEEREKGRLSPGMVADFIVVDRDVMTCPVQEIPKVQVLRTVIGGEIVYEHTSR